ncbi:MAG: cardiolipin synthase [Anaerovoracaceae bacterium]
MKNRIIGRLAAIFNRMTITITLICIQIGYFVILVYRLNNWYAKWISVGMSVLSFIVVLYVIWKDMGPAYKLGWVILIAFLPPFGMLLYLAFGLKRPTRYMHRRMTEQEAKHEDALEQVEDLDLIKDRRARRTVEYVRDHGRYPAWSHTKTKFYPLCDDMFPDMMKDMAQAKHYIFMEYFIISQCSMWDEMYEVMKKKADEGVDVRLIYDDFGCINRLPSNFVRDLNEHGISVITFNPVLPIFSVVYDNRDHRKIMVVDGKVGYTGGFNISDEYINRVVRFGHWKDTAIRLEGEAVWNLTVMFLNMWNSFKPWDKSYEPYKPHVYHPEPFESDGIVQPYSDTPLDNEELGRSVYLDIINQATDYVYITTPYFIVDSEMAVALELAAKRGVDVRVVVPGIPDKKIVYALTRSYVEQIMKSGVKFYTYTPGFIHAKGFVSDDRIGVVGTVNMDYRSFYLHFECGALLVENSSVMDIKKDCLELFQRSHLMTDEDRRKYFIGSLFGAVLRVLSPLL